MSQFPGAKFGSKKKSKISNWNRILDWILNGLGRNVLGKFLPGGAIQKDLVILGVFLKEWSTI